jgi:hypothetical protein
LRGKRDKLEQNIEELKSSSDSAWGDMKSGFEAAFQNLSDAMKSAKSRYD